MGEITMALLIERGGPKSGCFGGRPRQFLVESDRQETAFSLPGLPAAAADEVRAMLDSQYDVPVELQGLVAEGPQTKVYAAEAADAMELPDVLPHAERTSDRRLVWRTPAELVGRFRPDQLARALEAGWDGVLQLEE